MPPLAFTVLIPARLASTRLPNKPLVDIAGQPMVVRVAQRAQTPGAKAVVVATDSEAIAAACAQHGVRAIMTGSDHPSGSDRLAQACQLLGLDGDDVVVNLQGDEPLMAPALLDAVAQTLVDNPDCVMATAAHPLHEARDLSNPNVVKVVLNKRQHALYFSRAPIAWWRDGMGEAWQQGGVSALPPAPAPLRHIGLYAYRAGFLRQFPSLPAAPIEQCESLEQLRVLWHGERIAVHVTADAPGTGVDTSEDLERVRQHFARQPHL